MKQRVLSILCAVATLLGMVTVPAYAAEAATNGSDSYSGLQEAVDAYASGVIRLAEDAADITVTKDTYIDLNGHSIAGITVTGGVLYCVDSQTDDYTVADGNYGKVTGVTGAVAAEEGYLAITEAGAVSFHRVDLQLRSMSLRPGNVGVYYSSAFAGDEMVAAAVESYGIALSVAEEPAADNLETLCGYSAITGFAAGANANAANGTLLTGIMSADHSAEENAANAAMPVYGRAYIKTAQGYTFGTCVARDLQAQVEAIDGIWSALSETQKSGVLAMYDAYKAAMEDWNIPNIRGNQLGDTVITIPVESENGVVSQTVTVEQDGVSVTIPFGTLLAAGATELTLNVTRKAQSDSGIEAADDQTLMPFDVHVEGISPDNTVPLTVALGKVMPENLNMGNYSVYHVEENGTNAMELVANDAEFTAHNQYKYTLDGELTLHMATFSEVAAVTEDENGWNGEVDHSWYKADAEVLYIRTADQLWSFGQIVGGMVEGIAQDSFAGKTVKLLADINLDDGEADNDPDKLFYPIGYWNNQGKYKDIKGVEGVSSGYYSFNGIFDGNGNTISNFYQNTWEMVGDYNDGYPANSNYCRDGMGLFGKVYGGTVKNLTVKNFSCDSEHGTSGVIAAYADSQNSMPATFENISIFDCNPRVYNIGNGGIVGCAGWYSRNQTDVEDTPVTFRNITVDQSNKISALWDATGTSAGGILGQYYPNSNCGIRFENCHTAAIIEVNNDCCSNYHYYWYRYSGMLMGSVRKNKTEGGYTVADTTGITAENCTYTYGAWNEYWYCELVKNTIASYTHDHQFGRLTSIYSLSEIQDESGNWKTEGNFALLDKDRNCVDCYHIFKNSEGNLYRHFHDVADETNPNIYESFDLNGDGELNDLKEDRQRYYIPFGQLLTGDGMGVKAHHEFPGVTEVKDGTVKATEKFDALLAQNSNIEVDSAKKISELFEVKEGAKISESTIHVFVSPVGEESTVEATYACVSDGYMENAAVTFKGEGTAKITITDYYFCTPTVLYVTVGEAAPEPAEKFEATATTHVDAEKTVTLDQLFTEIAEVTDAGVDLTVTGGTYEYTKNEDDWTQSAISFTETATYTLTVTDGDNCIPTERTVTVNPIDKFDLVFENTDKYLYRVGNADGSTVALNLLFKALDGVTINSADVAFTTVTGNANGTYTSNATWNNGYIQFTGTGVVKVTITAANANPLILNLEVVDAVNTTSATSAIANNVVLLKDCGLSSMTVSGRYTFYGNGFTATYTGDGRYLNNGLKMGIVTVSGNGTLDNLRIKAPIYPAAYLYYTEEVKKGPSETETLADGTTKTRYYYQLSAVRAQDNATISNCYIFGARNNVYVDIGDVTIRDTVLESGTFANMQIISTSDYTITLDNVTTIQYMTHPTIGDTSINTMGAGIVVGDGDKEKLDTATNPKLILDGAFKQYNWVNGDDHENLPEGNAKTIVGTAFGEMDFWHTVNGKNASNFGIAYLNENPYEVENNTGLPYVGATVSVMNGVNGQVYSLQGATEDQIYWDYENADRTTVNGLYQPQFNYVEDLGGQYEAKSDTSDSYCYREGDVVRVMFPSDSTKELDLAALVNIVKYAGQDLGLKISCKDSSGNAVDLTDNKITLGSIETYTVTYTVTDSEIYDKNAEKVAGSVEYTWNVTLDVTLKDVSIPNAKFSFDSTKQKMGYYAPAWGDVKQYLPFLAGLKIDDYNGQEEYLRFDGDADYNKIASITITQYVSNEAYVEVKLTDGGVINTKFLARADSGGGSTYTGSIKTSNNTVYFVNGGGTSNKEATTTAAYWYVDYYKFTGNNGVAIQSAQQTFNSSGSSASTPSGSFSTTIKYTVTYDPNEGTCGQTVGYATSVAGSVTLPTPRRSGYIFAGWYTAASGGSRIGGAGDSYTPTANITLYAQWGAPCTVTYNANGGSVSPASAKYSGTALTLPTPTRDGYWFTGWYDAASGGNKIESPYNPTGEITLYAQWSPIYTVTYNANGGTVGTTSAIYTGTALELPAPTKANSTLVGWFDAATGGNKIGDAGAAYIPKANITLYAQWKTQVIVTYNYDGGTGSPASEVKYEGATVTLPTPTKTGYTFNGWYDAATGGNKEGNAGASYTVPAANVTLYAQWTKVSYTITVSKQDNATVTVDKTTASYGDTVSVTVNFSKNNSKTLTVKDASGNTVLSKSAAGTYTFTMPASNVMIEASSSGACVTPDTLVTMADGTQKEIQYVTYEDELVVWDFVNGCYTTAGASIVMNHGFGEYEIVALTFEDGTVVKTINGHGFYDVEEKKFVILNEGNVADFVGHTFIKQNGDGNTTVKLASYEIYTEQTESWSILTAEHYNCVLEGMLTLTPAEVEGSPDYLMPFAINSDLRYDTEAMQADIEKYGLYTYEEFAELLTYEQFVALNLKYFKVSVGKGYITYEDILFLIDLHM